jgi:hypothetical protein
VLLARAARARIIAADFRARTPDRALRHVMVVPMTVAMAVIVMIVPTTAGVGMIMGMIMGSMRMSWRVGVRRKRCLGIGHGAPLFVRL